MNDDRATGTCTHVACVRACVRTQDAKGILYNEPSRCVVATAAASNRNAHARMTSIHPSIHPCRHGMPARMPLTQQHPAAPSRCTRAVHAGTGATSRRSSPCTSATECGRRRRAPTTRGCTPTSPTRWVRVRPTHPPTHACMYASRQALASMFRARMQAICAQACRHMR